MFGRVFRNASKVSTYLKCNKNKFYKGILGGAIILGAGCFTIQYKYGFVAQAWIFNKFDGNKRICKAIEKHDNSTAFYWLNKAEKYCNNRHNLPFWLKNIISVPNPVYDQYVHSAMTSNNVDFVKIMDDDHKKLRDINLEKKFVDDIVNKGNTDMLSELLERNTHMNLKIGSVNRAIHPNILLFMIRHNLTHMCQKDVFWMNVAKYWNNDTIRTQLTHSLSTCEITNGDDTLKIIVSKSGKSDVNGENHCGLVNFLCNNKKVSANKLNLSECIDHDVSDIVSNWIDPNLLELLVLNHGVAINSKDQYGQTLLFKVKTIKGLRNKWGNTSRREFYKSIPDEKIDVLMKKIEECGGVVLADFNGHMPEYFVTTTEYCYK